MLQDLSQQPLRLEQYTDITEESVIANLGKQSISSMKDVSIQGIAAKEFIFNMNMNMNGNNLRIKQKNKTAYLFTYTAEPDRGVRSYTYSPHNELLTHTDPSGYEFMLSQHGAPDPWGASIAEIADRQHQSFMGWLAARGGGGSAHWRYGTGMDGSTTNPVTGVAQGFTTTDPALIAQLLTDPDARARYRKAANRGYYWEYSHTSYTADDETHTVVGHRKKVWLREDAQGGGGYPTLEYAPAHTSAFDGFWGKAKWFLFGGTEGGGSYDLKGNLIGPAPITGMAPTPGFKNNINANLLKQLEKQLAKDGVTSILKSYESLQLRLLEHQQKLPGLIYKSSVEREIRTWQRDLQTIKEFLKSLGH